jgi:hypothetical protein
VSALNIVVRRDSVLVVTDAVAFDTRSGAVVDFATKAAPIPSWPAVLATRGDPAATPLFASALGGRFKTFDAAVLGVGGAIADIHAQVKGACRGDTDSPIVLAGWSNDRQSARSLSTRT